MNEPPYFSPKPIAETQTATMPAQSEKRGILSRIVNGWLRFSAMNSAQTGASIEEQERVRHSRLLSAILFCSGVTILFLIPTAIPVPTYWIPIILNLSFSLIALVLNRSGRVTIAGIFFVLAIDATLVVAQVTLPTGIRNSNIPDYDLFILPVLISGSILPKRFIPFIAAMHIVIIVALFSLLPHDALLTQEIRVNQGGFAYSELSDAIIIQMVGAAIAWLGAWSVDRALLRASRAEDLAEARQRLNEQTLQIIEQKRRLDYGIDIVKDAHARFANGDFKARARLQDNELVPLAMSFNLLAERMNRIAHIAQDYARLEQALQQLLEVQQAILYEGTKKLYQPTGTLVDHMQPIIQRYLQLSSLISQNRSSLETVGKGLTQEQTMVAELTVVLSRLISAARIFSRNSDTGESQSSHSGPLSAPSRSSGPLSTSSQSSHSGPLSASSQAMSSSKLSAYLDTQMQLLEKAQEICAQLDEHKKQSLQELKRLASQLSSVSVASIPGTASSRGVNKNE